ncbi:MAG: pilus assembly protein PilM [Candidatus Brocadiaceae bacterium]|nr:pilus assembly protein PilM [Candidatus Brocadiaceae bacterium]
MLKLRKFNNVSKGPGSKAGKLSRFLQRKKHAAWGLDIGGNALKAVKITRLFDEVLIESMDSIEYRAAPTDGNILGSTCIKEALRIFLAKYRIHKTDRIIVSIPGQYSLARFTTIPSVSKRQLKGIINYEVKQQIPFDLKDIVWDYQQLPERTFGAEGVEIGLFAVRRSTLDLIVNNLESLPSQLTALQSSPLAVSNFVCSDMQTEGLSIVINLESDNTDLIILDGGHYWLRSIPLSTVDADYVKEIQRSLEYYKSLNKEAVEFRSILLMGNSFNDPLKVKTIADGFACEVKTLKSLNNFKLSEEIEPEYFNENLIDLGAALGLAIQGIGLGQTNINLLPQELIRAAEISKKKPYAIAVLGCLAFILISQYAGLKNEMSRLQSTINEHQFLLQKIREFEGTYNKVKIKAQKSLSALDLLSSLDNNRFFWMETLDKLLPLIPENVSLTGMQSSWFDEDTLEIENGRKKGSRATKKKRGDSAGSEKVLLIVIKGASSEPSIGFIEEKILKPIQELTLFEQKVPAFKNVEIVPGSCRQAEYKDGSVNYISFEIRCIVKSLAEIQAEIESLPSVSVVSSSVGKY